jgi:hypothetical protein
MAGFTTLYIKRNSGGTVTYPASGVDRLGNSGLGDIGVYIMQTKRKLVGQDKHFSIAAPETNYSVQTQEIEGGFKRTSTIMTFEGYLDSQPDSVSVQTKINYLWNIFEYGNPKYIFVNYRGKWIFSNTDTAGQGKCKIEDLSIEDDEKVSEPSVSSGGSPVPTSTQKRVKVVFSVKYVDPQ